MGIQTKVTFHTRAVVESIEDAAMKKMIEATDEVQKTTLETLSGPRTGRTYKVPDTNRTYTASAPGEPPAQATGALRQSVQRGKSIETERGTIVGKVGTDLKYGKELEFGRKNMAPRPWLKKSFEKSHDKVKAILSRKWL